MISARGQSNILGTMFVSNVLFISQLGTSHLDYRSEIQKKEQVNIPMTSTGPMTNRLISVDLRGWYIETFPFRATQSWLTKKTKAAGQCSQTGMCGNNIPPLKTSDNSACLKYLLNKNDLHSTINKLVSKSQICTGRTAEKQSPDITHGRHI